MDSILQPWLGPGEMARRLGVTIKALRVYEREGLVRAARSEAGWRLYGPAQAERLHAVLALRSLGMSLKHIKTLLGGDQTTLRSVLSLQEEVLRRQHRRTASALDLLAAARRRVDDGKPLTMDDIINLTRETVMPDSVGIQMLKDRAGEMLAAHQLTDEAAALIGNLRGQIEMSGETRVELWSKAQGLFAEAEILMASNDTRSDSAKELARRFWTLVPGYKRPATPKIDEVHAIYKTVVTDPAIATALPFNPAVLTFVGAIIKAMKDRGEL